MHLHTLCNLTFDKFFDSPLPKQLLVIGGSILVFFICWFLTKKFFHLIGTENGRFFHRRIKSIKLQNQEILKAEELSHLSSLFSCTLRRLINASLLSVLAVTILSQFSSTKHIPENVVSYLSKKYFTLQNEFIDFIPSLIFIIIVGFVASFIIRIVKLIFDGIDTGRVQINGFYQEWARPTFTLARLLIIAFAFIIVFPYVPGSQSPALKGLSIFIGVLVSLGSTSAITNIIAGIAITYMRAFQTGDRVRIAETTGDIVEKTLLVTRIRTPKNVVISIPNAMIMNNHIVNYSTHAKSRGILLHTTITIGYDVPWRKVHELLISSTKDIRFLEQDSPPFVLQKSLGDFSVEYELNVLCRHPRKTPLIYSQLNQSIQDKFNEAGVEIMSPTFSGIRDGNSVTIPEEYRDKEYQPQPFKLSQIFSGRPKIEK